VVTGSDDDGVHGGVAAWRDAYERLSAADPSQLSAAELDTLADALFWLDRPDESMAARRRAYQAYVAAEAGDAAMLASWRLYYDHSLVGEVAIAGGWLERARAHAAATGSPSSAAWLAVAEVDGALAAGDVDAALAHGARAADMAQAVDDRDLAAMALQAKGRALVDAGRVAEGIALLDEAMVAVINGELRALFTGWIYCNVLSTCHGLADVRRAAEWCDAALRWCDSLREGLLYPGLCRIYAVELECLRGSWEHAERDARRACDELTSHDPRYAGEAFYLVGEVRRLRGDFEGAQEAFTRAHELGRVPQPGLALVRLAQGRPDAAAKTLRLALEPGPPAPMPRARLLAALVEAELQAGDTDTARSAAHELEALGRSTESQLLGALARATEAAVLLAEGDATGALVATHEATSTFQTLGLPYDAARAQARAGVAARQVGDEETAALELRAAAAAFDRLGSVPDSRWVRGLLDETGSSPTPTPLTERELEVLRLVAQGSTNREIGEALFVSQHTVARHMSNIFTKIGVTSRAAATAYAYEHGVV
jgi:ATP/maltotriose-dependent transcriptional regulator MalT